MLTDRLTQQSGINKFLTEGVHYEAFASDEELRFKINYYLSNPEKAFLLAQNGFNTYWKYLSQKQLVKEMINRVWLNKSTSHFSFYESSCSPQFLKSLRAYQSIQEIHRRLINLELIVDDQLREDQLLLDLNDFPRIYYRNHFSSASSQIPYNLSSTPVQTVLLLESLDNIPFVPLQDTEVHFIVLNDPTAYNHSGSITVNGTPYKYDTVLDCYVANNY